MNRSLCAVSGTIGPATTTYQRSLINDTAPAPVLEAPTSRARQQLAAATRTIGRSRLRIHGGAPAAGDRVRCLQRVGARWSGGRAGLSQSAGGGRVASR